MKEDEVKKLKEELQEESNPRRVEKIKYLIQRMVIHLRIIHEKFTFKIFLNAKQTYRLDLNLKNKKHLII